MGSTAPGYRDAATPDRRRLTLSWRWFRFTDVVLLGFSLFWNGVLILWYSIAFTTDAPWITLVVPIAHVAIGVAIFLRAVAGLLNRTQVVVGERTLAAWAAPIWWWPGRVEVPIDRVEQLFVRRRERGAGRRRTVTYTVCVVVDGVAVDLVRSVPTYDAARYLERAVEAHLSIEDDPSMNQPA